jgi:hypothetical protein
MIDRKARSLALIAALAALIGPAMPAGAAFGFCMSPTAPTFFGSKPSKPFCATNRSCSQWEVDSYKRDIEQHFDKLERYVRQVDDFNEQARTYVRCMSEID